MSRRVWRLLASLAIALPLLSPVRADTPAAEIAVLSLDGAIHPASLRYVERGLSEAAEMGAELVILELDTPGGLLVSLREMTTAITASPVPVVVYVTPPGARAASAGFFILMAADVAAMAEGTNTGAAHPVAVGQDAPDAALDKATEDAAALVRSLASRRGRSVEWAEKAVRESLSYTAQEAKRHDLIEVIAPDREALVEALDGMRIERFGGATQVLELERPTVVAIEPTVAERLLMVLADPQVAYLLMMAGLIGLFIELTSPGLIVPGVAGGISLLLALYSFSVLPVNWVGALLILLGLGLLVAEALVTSYGLLAVAGVGSFVLGSMMLVDTPIPAFQIGLELIIPAAIVLGVTSVFLLARALRLQRTRSQTGSEGMVGEVGELVREIGTGHAAEGTVFVHGEHWTATADEPLPVGSKVRIEAIEGHRLRVSPTRSQPTWPT